VPTGKRAWLRQTDRFHTRGKQVWGKKGEEVFTTHGGGKGEREQNKPNTVKNVR